jgi:hypothetical protein
MNPSFIITVSNEHPAQLIQCLSFLKRSYPQAAVAIISDGSSMPMDFLRDAYGLTHVVAGQRLKTRGKIWRWWDRFFACARKLPAGTPVFKLDPDAVIHRPFDGVDPVNAMFGTVIGNGTEGIHVQGGIQGFGSQTVNTLSQVIKANLAQLTEQTGEGDEWASSDLTIAHLCKLVGIPMLHFGEVLSMWKPEELPALPQISGFAATHPHKVGVIEEQPIEAPVEEPFPQVIEAPAVDDWADPIPEPVVKAKKAVRKRQPAKP